MATIASKQIFEVNMELSVNIENFHNLNTVYSTCNNVSNMATIPSKHSFAVNMELNVNIENYVIMKL